MNRKPEAQDALGRAIASYSATTKEAPDDLDALRGLGEALGNQARIAYEMGRTTDALHSIEKAVPIYEEVVRRSPRDLSARVGLGRLLLNHGYYASNLNLLESSGRFSPKCPGGISKAGPGTAQRLGVPVPVGPRPPELCMVAQAVEADGKCAG